MQDKDNLLTRIETAEFIVAKRKDGIIHVYFKPGITITVVLQNKLLAAYYEITGGKKTPFIFEAGQNIRLTSEARSNSINLEDQSPVLITAVHVRSWVQKVLANFYVRIMPHKQPYKVVTDFQKGIEWLKATEISYRNELETLEISK